MDDAVRALELVNIVAFTALAAIAVRLWLRRRDDATFWAMLAFGAIAVVLLAGIVLPEHPSALVERTIVRLDIVLLLVFPYLLYKFTTAFDPPSVRVTRAFNALTVVIIVWTFVQPRFPEEGEPWPRSFAAYVFAFLAHWAVLSIVSAARLWRAGSGQPGVARRRMRLLAAASGGLTVALFLAVGAGDTHDEVRIVAQALACLTAVAFGVGLAPPQALRWVWRNDEQRRLQQAIESLMTLAKSREEVVERVLAPMADIVGARAVELRDEEGVLLGSHEAPARRGERTEKVQIDVPGGSVTVWTTAYAPFFGEAELELVRTLGALTGLALDRVRLFMQEHETRLALERANETMTNFVALAAHELRTPITSIHGFVHTLNHLGDRLSEAQKREISETLQQQTRRMAQLVEQLLDLSRLDADAVEIAPERLRIRDKVADLVEAAVADRADSVAVDVPEELEAEVDPNAFDRIVGNLITNAFRYGQPPVLVRAEHKDRHLYVTVEDRGRGVPAEFVPDLFERFSRSDHSRARATGTGLGLAIARSYARAHGGDLVYEPARPSGALFRVVLPADARTR